MQSKEEKGTIETSDTDFVNRVTELKELRDHREDVMEKGGKLVLIKGEAGIGKTKLAEQFAEECSDKNFRIFQGRCLYYESTEPYIPFIEAFEDFMGEKENPPDEVDLESNKLSVSAKASTSVGTSDKAMSLVGFSGERSEDIENISLKDEREMLFTKVLDLIKKISKEHPVFLFLDDLQSIDESSSQLLHFLARNISDHPVMIVGAHRPEELKRHGETLPLENLLERLRDEKRIETIELKRLGFGAVSEITKNHIQTRDLPESFLLMVSRESEGNPYYLEEILNSLVLEGIIDPYSYSWNPREELSEISIPSGIKDITHRRIDSLEREEKRVLMFASVIGQEFNFEILENAMNMDVIELLDLIDRLIEHAIIQEKTETEEEIYRFNHLQVRTTLYDNMGKSRKRVLNKQIGETIEKLYENDLERYYYPLSRHFYEGKVMSKAYEYSIKAAEKALKALAIENALEYYERALESVRKARDIEKEIEKEEELLKKIGDLRFEMGDLEESENAFKSLVDIYEKKRDENKDTEQDRFNKAEALRYLGHVYKEKPEIKKAKKYYQRAYDLSEELDDKKGLADCLRGEGYIAWRESNFEEAIEKLESSIERGQEIGEEDIVARSEIALGNSFAHKGDSDLAIQYYKRSLPVLESQNAYRDLARANNNIGDQYMKKEDWPEAIKFFEKSIENAKKIANKSLIGWAYFNKAEAFARKGDFESARRIVNRSEEILKSLDDNVGLASVYRVKSLIERRLEEWDEAKKHIEKSVDILKNYDMPFTTGETKYDMGRLYQEKGNKEKARQYLQEAFSIFKTIGSPHFEEKAKKHLDEIKE